MEGIGRGQGEEEEMEEGEEEEEWRYKKLANFCQAVSQMSKTFK